MRFLPYIGVLILLAGLTVGSRAEESTKTRVARRQAMEKLAQNPDEKAIPVLLKGLKEKDAYTRMLAVRGLARSKSPQALSPLIQTLKDDKIPEVRETVAMGLRLYPGDAARQALTQALTDADERVRVAATGSLTIYKDEAMRATFSKLSEDPSALVRQRAAVALTEIKPPEERKK